MAPRQKAKQITMEGARIAIESNNVTSRSSGLDDLVHIFKEQTKASNFSVLDDKSFHVIFDSLFRCALTEKQAYYNKKSTAATRLTKCAEALRLGVELGAGKIKRKTVLAVIDHISQTLPHPEDDLVPPLIQDYIKALAALLSHAANIELLAMGGGDGWFTCVDFVVDILTLYLAAADKDPIFSRASSRASPAPGTAQTMSLSLSTPRSTAASQRTNRVTRSQLPDLLQCLLYLASTPNAPLLQRSKEVSSVIIQVLQLRPLGIGQLHQLAFALMNKFFVASQTDDSSHANSLAMDCLPLVSQWWQTKTASAHDALLNGVRVEMLKLMFNMYWQLEFLIKQNEKPSLLGDIENLAELFWSEYSRREDRARLQHDDLSYSTSDNGTNFQLQSFSLRPFNIDGEKQWAVIHVLALLECLMWKNSQQSHATSDSEQPRKRQRTTAGFSRLRQKLRSIDQSVQYTALQIIPFFVSDLEVGIDEMTDLLSFLMGQMASKNNKVATWAMIACASLAPQTSATDSNLTTLWKQVWQVAVRSVSMTANCRASSFLLYSIVNRNLVSYRDIADDVNSIVTTADVNGPAVVVDSSLMLMTTLLHLRNFQLPSASYTTCNHVVRWMFFRWDPADLAFISSYSSHVLPLDIVNLIKAAYGDQKLVIPRPSQTISGPIGETLGLLRGRESLIRYLLLLESSASECSPDPHQPPASQLGDTTNAHGTKKLAAELFYSKLNEVKTLCEAWDKQKDKSTQITPERLQSVISSLIAGALILPEMIEVDSNQSQEIQQLLFEVLQAALDAASNSSEGNVLHECLLTLVRSYMPTLSSIELSKLGKEWVYLHRLFSELSAAFRKAARSQSSNKDDFMDLDDEFESDDRRSRASSKSIEISRHESSIVLQAAAFYSDTIQRLYLLDVLYGDNGQIGLVPASFLDSFLELPDEELLSCRCLLRELFESDLIINPDDATRVIIRMGELIGGAAFSNCETALNVCLDVMEGLMPIWSDSDGEISSHAGDLYHYFVNSGLKKNILSTSSQMALARLLLRLAQLNEKFPDNIRMPPPSESLFNILGSAAIPVKYYIGTRLPSLFGRYVLKSHDGILVDVLDVLPSKSDFLEGIALRLFVLAELAREWPTLLRRGIYHIFEIPGEITGSTKHAARCLSNISASLHLESTQQLFDLFAPQILYTWLENKDIEDIPYMIFGFSSLGDLLRRAQSEVVALMVMRGQDEAVTNLATTLGDKLTELVQRNFSRIMAYSMAHDVSIIKAQQNQSGEGRTRKVLGKQAYFEALNIHFVDIVGLFFRLIDQEDPIEKSWAKEKAFEYAAETMTEIKNCGYSEMELSPNQQPMFRAKYLTREIDLLCNRTPPNEMATLWTPALVVSVARRLFNGVHPALGSLHMCSVLRKVRVLICLAGEHAWASYPLEMLLQSIRPLIVDTECADDALGMSQYLLNKGKESLSRSPSFLAGYALSALASLRVFLETSQSSTTQESQFKATMNKAQRFHSWFTKYLEDYKSPLLQDDEQRNAFEVITRSAAHVRSSGNAERGTNESKLLLGILQDGVHGPQLLNEPSRKLALEMLCGHFSIPASHSVDVVSTDEEALDLATVVWKSCQAQGLSDEYLAWAGRVVGRGFASSGHIERDLLRESELSRYFNVSLDASGSEHGLLSLLQSLTSDSDCYKAGLAESALRTVVSEALAQGDDNLSVVCQKILSDHLRTASDWSLYRTPPSDNPPINVVHEDQALSNEAFENAKWAQGVTVYLAQAYPENIILNALPPILTYVKGFAQQAFPFIVHLVLLFEREKQQSTKRALSNALKGWLKLDSPAANENLGLVINAILYLRTQQLPGENSIADRTQWVDLDLLSVASAASRCGMFKTALLFVEMASTEGSRTSRRSSAVRAQESTDVLMDIFENIDDPDAYYGLSHTSSLSNVLARLEYEKNGSMSLAFRGAQYDSHIRRRDPAAKTDSQLLVSTLGNLGLSGLSHSLLQSQENVDDSSTTVESTFSTARRLEIWNLPAPSSTENHSVTLYKAYQAFHQTTELGLARMATYNGFSETMRNVARKDLSPAHLRRHLGTLAVLTELNDTIGIADSTELDKILTTFTDRSQWMKSGRYEDVSHILSCRETTLSLLAQASQRRGITKVNPPEATLARIKSMILSSSLYRYHRATQESLNIATSLTDLVPPSEELGLHLDSIAKIEAAGSLWDHGEMTSSIRMLQSVEDDPHLKKQTIPISRPDLLAKTGYQISVAKLEKPEAIQKDYLQPALKELKGKTDGQEAGKVYHQFAMFCDEQLQNPDGLEDLMRLQHLKKGKSDEVEQLKGIISSTSGSQDKKKYQNHLQKAQQWLELDAQELRRVEQNRTEFVRLSLENYLLSLISCDDHNNDALRFTALWLERSAEDFTNEAVRKYIDKVPTRKFAPLMNQLTSRLVDQTNPFQKVLIELVYRICVDHPYHGMYSIWSGMRSRPNKEDDVAMLRQKATEKVGRRLKSTPSVATVWAAIDNTNRAYHSLAIDRDNPRYKAGQKLSLRESTFALSLASALVKWHVPPPTMQIELSASRDYSEVPYITKVEPSMSIASGVSAPKIITVVGSNGERFKQLVKGGNDDLRQDAIMEQVFAAVSSVLQHHRSTQQRNLGIRTYKVLPLTQVSGLIEFVSNTVPLHEYLMPAHERYHPKDLKGSQCRKEISQVQGKSSEVRVSTYKRVTDRFQPVMRYFFMEHFADPDEWFARRTAYTRTTAAVSILGHILGLGDRHGHNILLDSKSGEVVHIDLGVAFEMGRVLPVPELVPFRLTRDIVDGMGVSGTEGVFRRCCEFTLDALRDETYSIMTILDVLRYDPLYSWSISPVRIARLQDTRRDGLEGDVTDAEVDVNDRKKSKKVGGGTTGVVNEPSEADRALEVVRKKLSKTLSVTATVNDLINQASDERNLALLYSGWAAYA